MKNERRKFGKRKALIFAVLLVIQVFISVGCTSAITIYANPGESPQASFQVRSGMTVLSNNDTITSGSQLVRYTYGMSVYNTNDTSDTVLGNLEYILQADNIIDVEDEEYADWNESYVKWVFPSNYSLVEDDWLYVSAETSFFETKYIPMSMSRRLNKTIFDSDSYQLAEFNVTFDEINFDSCTGIITAEENSLVNASFVLDTLSVDEPFELDYKILDEHYIEFYVYNGSQLQANKTYKFSVVVRVDLKGNNPSPILYKPEYEILFGPHRWLYPDYIGSNVTIPSEGLPEHIHYAYASTNGSNTWYIPRQPHTTTSCRLEEISDPLGPTISIYTDKTSYTIGDTMRLGLDVTNSGDALPVRFAVWLEMPDGGIVPVQYTPTPVTLPAGLNYCNPNFMVFPPLPSLPAGTYTWHAALIEPSGPIEFISHNIVEWDFIGRGVSIEIEDITEMLEQTAVVIDFGE